MATFQPTPDAMPAPQSLVTPGFPQRPPTGVTFGPGFGGNRSVQNFAAQPAGGGGNLTLDALVQRQKEAMAAQAQNMNQGSNGTILGGLGQMTGSFFNALQQRRAEKEEGQAWGEISEAMGQIDPATGLPSQDVISTIMKRSPELGMELYKTAMKARQDAASQEHWEDIPAPEGSKPGQLYQRNSITGEVRTAGGSGLTIDTGSDSKMSDWASNDAKFYMQGASANMDLEEFDTALAGAPDVLAQFVPGSQYLTSPEYQKAQIAGDSWIMSVLRPESGGVIGAEEMDQHRKTYLPQPGDTRETIEYKRQLRQQKTEYAAFGVKATAPNTWAEMQAALTAEREMRRQRRANPAATPANPADPANPAPATPPRRVTVTPAG